MTQLSTKIKLYVGSEVDFTTDVLLQDDRMAKVFTLKNGTYLLLNQLKHN